MLISLLRVQGIEVGRAKGEIKLTDGTYPAGSFIIKRDQPYGRLAKILLEKQNFPDANLRTYDDTGWTMGLMLQTEVKATADKAVARDRGGAGQRIQGDRKYRGGGRQPARGRGVHRAESRLERLVTLRYALKDVAVQAAENVVQGGDDGVSGGLVHHRGQAAIAT